VKSHDERRQSRLDIPNLGDGPIPASLGFLSSRNPKKAGCRISPFLHSRSDRSAGLFSLARARARDGGYAD
jgi:hypothetical protein